MDVVDRLFGEDDGSDVPEQCLLCSDLAMTGRLCAECGVAFRLPSEPLRPRSEPLQRPSGPVRMLSPAEAAELVAGLCVAAGIDLLDSP